MSIEAKILTALPIPKTFALPAVEILSMFVSTSLET